MESNLQRDRQTPYRSNNVRVIKYTFTEISTKSQDKIKKYELTFVI